MPLYNKLKEYRAKLGVNQQEMGSLSKLTLNCIAGIFDSFMQLYKWL